MEAYEKLPSTNDLEGGKEVSETRGEVLARSIVTKLDAHRQLNEEILCRLIGLVSETVKDGDGEIDQSLVELEQDMSSRYVASDMGQLEGFSLGACWGALQVLRAVAEAASEAAALSRCVEVIRLHRKLFQTVNEHPGIIQGQLADALGEKKSGFSQKLARLEKYQMLTVSVVGRSKHLYLTRRGREALRQASIEMEGCAAHGLTSNATLGAADE